MAGNRAQLFRDAAIARLSSPEQLDTLIRVVTPNAWLALAPLLALIALALAWSWLGSLPVKVEGRCILLNPTGLADVVSAVSGRVVDMPLKVGDAVAEGQEVARVAQPDLADRIEKAEARLRELEAQGQVVRLFSQRSEALSAEGLLRNRANLESQVKAAVARSELAAERASAQEELRKDGLVTARTVVATRQEKLQADLEAESLRNQIKQLELRRLEAEKLVRNELASSDTLINEARRTLDSLRQARKQSAAIVSLYSGRVVELKTTPGALVGPGSSVLTVERADSTGTLEAVAYLPAVDGKKVRPGMEAQITPSTVRREEYGFMAGRVAQVADYPATPQSMMLRLQNEALAKELAGSAPPFEVRATLAPAPTPSGYRWSSAKGAPVSLSSGTLCAADIIVDRQRPISLVIPILRKSLGLE